MTAVSAQVSADRLDNRVMTLVGGLVAVATAALVAVAAPTARIVSEQPARIGSIVALTLLLQLCSIRVYGRGSVSVSAIGVLSAAFLLGAWPAMVVAALAALVQGIRGRGRIYKVLFDIANFTVAAGAAALLFSGLSGLSRLLAAIVAGCVYAAVNNGLLCLVMSLSEGAPVRTVWFERFHWARYYFVSFGPLALAATIAYEQIGVTGLVAFALPPALMILSVREYLGRTSAAVEEVREVNLRLKRAHRDTIAALSRSLDVKDNYTAGHTDRVAAVALALARELGFKGEELEAVEIGALLHDIGKIGIPERILLKQGPLDESEWDVIKTHPLISDYILSELDLHPIVRECARSSHERVDGTGYPDRLAGDAIPLPARIVLVADALDALTSERPYRNARPLIAALAEIQEHAGTQFCPRVVAALRTVWQSAPQLLTGERTIDRTAA